jgi:hypothetical protein
MMSDTPAVAVPSALNIHPKVSLAIFAGSAATVMIGVLKAKFGIDLTDYGPDLVVVIMGAVGYFVPSVA